MTTVRERKIKHPRVAFLLGAFFLISGVIFFRLVDLQIFKNKYYSTLAENQYGSFLNLVPKRGEIFLHEKDGNIYPLATNKVYQQVFAVPKEIEDKENTAKLLAPVLYDLEEEQNLKAEMIKSETQKKEGEKKEESSQDLEEKKEERIKEIETKLLAKFSIPDDPYEPLAYKVEEKYIERIKSLNLAGIAFKDENFRFYPEGKLAAHLLGFVGFEGNEQKGRYGLEGYFDKDLAGEPGFLQTQQDTQGRWITFGKRELKPAKDGAKLFLTIDRLIQYEAEEILQKGVEKYKAEGGNIIVMNPKTGAILALANFPTFNPNYYGLNKEIKTFSNPAIFDLFEPGSIFKPIVMAAAINEGLIEPHSTMEDKGPVRVGEYTIDTYDGQHWGIQTMTQILEKSNNVGMVWVTQKLGIENLYDYMRRFGFGERTGITLDFETGGTVRAPSDWNMVNLATAGFGQGVAMTPLQITLATAALANNGKLMQPYLVEKIIKSNGEEVVFHPKEIREVITPSTAAKVTAMMVSVIENGVGKLAQVKGYHLAGKTGTAQVPSPQGGYYGDRKIISFTGFGPIDDPQFVILVKLDNPAGLSFASGTTAPMFHDLAEKILKYYKIPPTEKIIEEEKK